MVLWLWRRRLSGVRKSLALLMAFNVLAFSASSMLALPHAHAVGESEGNVDSSGDQDAPAPGGASSSGSLTSGPTGAASFSIPIAVPPGKDGAQPALALAYGSDNPAGWLGKGWMLSAGEITRLGSDGQVPAYGASDTFRIGALGLSSKLIATGGNGFATSYQTFTRIEKNESANSWQVWLADGRRAEFAQAIGRGAPAAGTTFATTRAWLLTRVVNSNGYAVEFAYSYGDPGADPTQEGDYYLARVDYTRGNGLDTGRSITVELEPSETRLSSAGGELVRYDRRLRFIRVWADHDRNLLYRAYRLHYFQNTLFPGAGLWTSLDPQLVKVEELGSNGTSILNRWQFDYTQRQVGWGDRVNASIPALAVDQPQVNSFKSSDPLLSEVFGLDIGMRAADLTGAGLLGYLQRIRIDDYHTTAVPPLVGGAKMHYPVEMSFPTTFGGSPIPFSHHTTVRRESNDVVYYTSHAIDEGVVIIDINGDGYPDLVKSQGGAQLHCTDLPVQEVYLHEGLAHTYPVWTAAPEWAQALPSWARFVHFLCDSQGRRTSITLASPERYRTNVPFGARFANLNGDRFPDLLIRATHIVEDVLDCGGGVLIACTGTSATCPGAQFPTACGGEVEVSFVGAALNNGDGTWTDLGQQGLGNVPVETHRSSTLALDLNGDGLDDLVRAYFGPSTCTDGHVCRGGLTVQVWLNAVDQWQRDTEWEQAFIRHRLGFAGQLRQREIVETSFDVAPIDVNNDGLVDFVSNCSVFVNTGSKSFVNVCPGTSGPGTRSCEYDIGWPLFDQGLKHGWYNSWLASGVADPSETALSSTRVACTPRDVATFKFDTDVDIYRPRARGVTYMDANGDGTTDVMYGLGTLSWVYDTFFGRYGWRVTSLSNGVHLGNEVAPGQVESAPGLLSRVTLPAGGSLEYAYKSSTHFDNRVTDVYPNIMSRMFIAKPVVTSTTADDGRGNRHTSRYTYSGGAYDPASGEFLGFREMETTDAQDRIVKTFYHHEPPLLGQLVRSETWSAVDRSTNQRRLLQSADNTYGVGGVIDEDKPYYNPLRRSTTTTYGAGSQRSAAVETDYELDAIGLITRQTTRSLGEVDAGGNSLLAPRDQPVSVSEFRPNTDLWLVSLPAREAIYRGDNLAAPVSETRFVYQGNTSWDAPSQQAQVVRTEKRWVRDTQSPGALEFSTVTETEYDPTYRHPISTTEYRDGTPLVTRTFWDGTSNGAHPAHMYPTRVCNALDHCSESTYDVYGNVASRTDANQIKIENHYDIFQRLERTVRYTPQGAPTGDTTFAYLGFCDQLCPSTPTTAGNPNDQYLRRRQQQVAGQLESEWPWQKTYSDGLSREYKTVTKGDARGDVIALKEFDAQGRAYRVSVPFFANDTSTPLNNPNLWTTVTYDAAGRVETQTTPSSAQNPITTRYAYDGWTKTVTDPRGFAKRYEVDGFGRLQNVTEWVTTFGELRSHTARYAYDVLGNLITVSDEGGFAISMLYDGVGRKTEMTDPDMGHWTYGYDSLGNLETQLDAKLNVTEFHYDLLNRLEQKDYLLADGSLESSAMFVYDQSPDGRPTGASLGQLVESSVSNGVSARKVAYDELGRVAWQEHAVSLPNDPYPGSPRRIRYEYDVADAARVMELDAAGYDPVTGTYSLAGAAPERVRYVYRDGLGQLAGLRSDTLAYDYVSDVVYDALAREVSLDYGNGVSAGYIHDTESDLRLREIVLTGPADPLLHRVYDYDAAGNLMSLEDRPLDAASAPRLRTYDYDELNRLAWAEISVGGNVTERRDFTIDVLNRMRHVAGAYAPFGESYSGVPVELDSQAPADPQNLQMGVDASWNAVLTWDPVPDADLAGYNVYRTSNLYWQDRTQPPAQWFKLNPAPVTQTTFVDTTPFAAGEMLFFYYVTAIDTSGNESLAAPTAKISASSETSGALSQALSESLTVDAGAVVQFSAAESFDANGIITSFVWDFDASNGLARDAVGREVTAAFEQAGVFVVTLSVMDNDANEAKDTIEIVVLGDGPLPPENPAPAELRVDAGHPAGGCSASGAALWWVILAAAALVWARRRADTKQLVALSMLVAVASACGKADLADIDISTPRSSEHAVRAPYWQSGTKVLSESAVELWFYPDPTLTTRVRVYRDSVRIIDSPYLGVTSPCILNPSGSQAVICTNSGLTPGTTYNYQVSAVDKQTGVESGLSSRTLTTLKPAGPSNPSAVAVAYNRVDLTWGEPPNPAFTAHYEVSRDGDPLDGTYDDLGFRDNTNRTWSDTGRKERTEYRYRIIAFDANGNSTEPATASATTPADPRPPTGVSATALSETSINVSWAEPADTSFRVRYEIFRDGGPGDGTYDRAGESQQPFFNDTGLAPYTVYYYYVIAYDAGGVASPQSTPVAGARTLADTERPTPQPVLTFDPVTTTSVRLNWTGSTDNVGVARYDVYRSDNIDTPLISLGADARSHTDTGLLPCRTYQYHVAVMDAAGNGNSSGWRQIQTRMIAPLLTAQVQANPLRVSLMWTSPNIEIAGYWVYRDGAPLTQSPILHATYADREVLPESAYTYSVLAFTSAGQQILSNSFTLSAGRAPQPPQDGVDYYYDPRAGGPVHAPSADSHFAYTYDANGNLETVSDLASGALRQRFEYTVFNKTARVVDFTSGETSEYFYGPDGDRVGKIVAGAQTHVEKLFGPIEQINSEERRSYILGGRRIAERNLATHRLVYHHQDHLGSASLTTDSAGQEILRREYYEFGAIAEETVHPDYAGDEHLADFAYNDKRRDRETDFYDYGARLYAAKMFIFTTPDSIVPDPENPQTFNRYAYALNNPLRYVDPSGHFSLESALNIVINYVAPLVLLAIPGAQPVAAAWIAGASAAYSMYSMHKYGVTVQGFISIGLAMYGMSQSIQAAQMQKLAAHGGSAVAGTSTPDKGLAGGSMDAACQCSRHLPSSTAAPDFTPDPAATLRNANVGLQTSPLPQGQSWGTASTQDFGWRVLEKRGVDYHWGLDAPGKGFPVFAAHDGIAATAGMSGASGNLVTLQNGPLETFYAHLDSLTVAKGQFVHAGDLVGFAGNTGGSFGAHLHFGMAVNGFKVDPNPYLQATRP